MAFVPKSSSKINELEELFFEQATAYNILVGDILSNPHIFAKWELTKEGTSPDNFAFLIDVTVLSIMRRTSGAGSVRFGMIRSIDDITWSTINFNSSTDVADTAKVSQTNTNFNPNDRFIALAAFNTGATDGFVSRFKGHVLALLPFGDSIERIL